MHRLYFDLVGRSMHLRAAAGFGFWTLSRHDCKDFNNEVAVPACPGATPRPLAPDGQILWGRCLIPRPRAERAAAISRERSLPYVRHLADRRGGAVVEDQGTGPAVHRSSRYTFQKGTKCSSWGEDGCDVQIVTYVWGRQPPPKNNDAPFGELTSLNGPP